MSIPALSTALSWPVVLTLVMFEVILLAVIRLVLFGPHGRPRFVRVDAIAPDLMHLIFGPNSPPLEEAGPCDFWISYDATGPCEIAVALDAKRSLTHTDDIAIRTPFELTRVLTPEDAPFQTVLESLPPPRLLN